MYFIIRYSGKQFKTTKNQLSKFCCFVLDKIINYVACCLIFSSVATMATAYIAHMMSIRSPFFMFTMDSSKHSVFVMMFLGNCLSMFKAPKISNVHHLVRCITKIFLHETQTLISKGQNTVLRSSWYSGPVLLQIDYNV